MTGARPQPPLRVPTLTEVVEMPWPSVANEVQQPEAAMLADSMSADSVSAEPVVPVIAAPPVPAVSALPSEDQIVQRVLHDLQRQIDLMLDYRLREALMPVLTRATDALVLEARSELASTLRDIVARSVAQEMSRHRGR